MGKTLITLHQKYPDLSSDADFNKGLGKQPYNPVELFAKALWQSEADREKRQKRERAVEDAKHRQQRLIRLKEAYKRRIKIMDNLKLVFAILTSRKEKIQLIPVFDQQAFLEAVSQELNYIEKFLLAQKVSQMFEALNQEINFITSGADPNLYYQYHKYDPDLEIVTCSYNGEPVYKYGGYVATSELSEMEAENKVLMKLSSELNDLLTIEPCQELINTTKQALEG